MNRIATIIAILDNAIAHLWDGVGKVLYKEGGYRQTPEYMCHAVEFAISEVVKGDRTKVTNIRFNEEYGVELREKIMATIPGYLTADSYMRNKGVYADADIQAFRKQSLQAIRAEYAAKLAKIVKPSELISYAAIHNFHDKDGRYEWDSHHRSMFTCIAAEYAADEFKDAGKDATEALKMVKAKIAEALGVAPSEVGTTLESVLSRMFGAEFVESQGFDWKQARRMDMMQRIAQQLRNEGN